MVFLNCNLALNKGARCRGDVRKMFKPYELFISLLHYMFAICDMLYFTITSNLSC